MKPLAAWMIGNGLLVAVLLLAVGSGWRWLEYAVAAFMWLTLLVYLAVLLGNPENAGRHRSPVPEWVGWGVDVAILAILLWNGWLVTAVAHLGACVCLNEIQERGRGKTSMQGDSNER